MDKPTWGCPDCGSTEIIQHVKLSATRDGKFRASGESWEFDTADQEYDRDTIEVDEEGDFECSRCRETFDKPARVREGAGIRLALRVRGEAFEPDEHGVEQAMDDDFSARFEIACADKVLVARLFETLRLFLKGVTETARAGGEREAA